MVDRATDRARLTWRGYNRIRYVLELMEVRSWFPAMTEAASSLLRRCDSHLEKMFILGWMCAMDTRRQALGFGAMTIFEHGERWGFDLPFLGHREGRGPLSMTVRPQLPRAGLVYDFGLYYSGRLAMAIEVDGYLAHRRQRSWDEAKARKLAVPVVRLYEETDDPRTWAETILDWTRPPCDHCGEHIHREHSCPPF